MLVLVEPSASGGARAVATCRASDAVDLLVGPEGGWTPDESRGVCAQPAFRLVSLGGRTLRADAAPLVAMAAIYERWNAVVSDDWRLVIDD